MSTSQKTTSWRSRGARHSHGTPVETVASPAEARIQEMLRTNDDSLRSRSSTSGRSSVDLDGEEGRLPRSNGQTCSTLTVLVADDHPVVREGLVTLINRQPDMRVIAQASNGREAAEKFLALHPDIALIDLRMSVMDGIEAVNEICAKDPKARIAIITSYQSEEDIYRALRAGAQGYILKDASIDELVRCIHAVVGGKNWIPPQVGAKLAKRLVDQELTRRETEVLHALAAGKGNKEIGSLLNISEATVKVHMTHILEKLKVTGRTEAINVAAKRGLIRLDGAAAGYLRPH
jgi:two-component system, NarL family, response regulator